MITVSRVPAGRNGPARAAAAHRNDRTRHEPGPGALAGIRVNSGYPVDMATVRAIPPRGRRQARPGRGVLVATDLADLRGAVTGTAELPLRLFWHPDRTFDLGQPAMLAWMYEIVLREATRPGDLTGLLDGATLTALWPALFLPRAVRQAWEDQHPVLRAAAQAPAA